VEVFNAKWFEIGPIRRSFLQLLSIPEMSELVFAGRRNRWDGPLMGDTFFTDLPRCNISHATVTRIWEAWVSQETPFKPMRLWSTRHVPVERGRCYVSNYRDLSTFIEIRRPNQHARASIVFSITLDDQVHFGYARCRRDLGLAPKADSHHARHK